MANDLTTVFLPLIAEDRMADFSVTDLTLSPRATDSGRDVQFQEAVGIDPTIFMMAPGEAYLVLAGTTVTLANGKGPEITAPANRHVLAMHVFKTYEWAPVLTPTGQPIAEWWAVEGIWLDSFEAFVNLIDLAAEAAARGYGTADAYRTAIMAGAAGFNVLLGDEEPAPIASLDPPANGAYSFGLRAWATYDTGLLELDAASALASFKQLAPSLEPHPLLGAVLGDVSTSDVTIHVRFVYWLPNVNNAPDETHKGSFDVVPPGSTISLQKKDSAGTYTAIVEAETLLDGQVVLVAPRAALNAVNLAAGEKLLFRVDIPPAIRFTPQYQHNGTPRKAADSFIWGVFPTNTWVTEGRSTTDEAIDSLDFLVNYSNSVVGSSSQPIEYYAGIPVFLQITYPVVYYSGAGASAKFETLTRKAPKGLLVEIRDANTPASQPPLGTFRTDEHGQIWGTLLQAYDGMAAPFEVLVWYEIEDSSIGLPKIEGEVVEGGHTIRAYSSNNDARNSAALSVLKCSLGKRGGGARATALLTVQAGFVEIKGHAVSRFVSDGGRHAGMLHALQQVRYMHQWFKALTTGFMFGGADESWAAAIARHDNKPGANGPGPGGAYNVLLPKIRVTEPKTVKVETGQPDINEGLQGEVALDYHDLANLRWWLVLYGFDDFAMNQKVRVPDGKGGLKRIPFALVDQRLQFWRVHTIWHEFTHAVINMAWNRLLDFNVHTAWNNAKNPLASGAIHELIQDEDDKTLGKLYGGWSTLEEGLASVPEAALMRKMSGAVPEWDPGPTANPRYLVMDHDASGHADHTLDKFVDLKLDDGPLPFDKIGGGAPVNDRRLGLRVPIAFTWALWTALEQVGAFDRTVDAYVTGTDPINELDTIVPYLRSAGSRQVFQSLFWGPLVASRTPDIAGAPPQWNDFTTPAPAPTTASFIAALQNNFWAAGLGAADRAKVKALFGDADNPESYYLSFTLP